MRSFLDQTRRSVPRCSPFDLQSFESYLEECGDDVLVACSRRGDLGYLMCCKSSSDHLLFSCSSMGLIPGAKVYPGSIHSLPLSLTWFLDFVHGLRDLCPF